MIPPELSQPDFSLEPPGDLMREQVQLAMKYIVEHIESLPFRPAADVDGAVELARSLREPLPEEGRPLGELLELLFHRAAPKSFTTTHPGYLAYIPGGGLFHSALADFLGGVINRYVGVFAAAPALVQLEANVVRWLCEMVEYPESSGGFLTTGGSLANFSAVFTARRNLLPDDFLSGRVYISDQAHHSVPRAALLAGFSDRAVRTVATDARYRLRRDELERLIRADREAGHRPFMVIANGGTVNTGAVDDLDGLADLAARERVWLHVDAAYGGLFMLTARGRAALRGIARADSITLDPHKGMFLPYGTGSLLVRDRATLRRAHAYQAEYLPSVQDDPDLVDFYQISPELSRAFRGLRVWLPVKLHGAGAFRRNLEEKLDLTEWATAELRRMPHLKIVAEPQLSLVAFRLEPPGRSAEALDALNREFLHRVNRKNRVHLSGTLVGGRFVLRICVLSFRTHFPTMQHGIDDLREAASELA